MYITSKIQWKDAMHVDTVVGLFGMKTVQGTTLPQKACTRRTFTLEMVHFSAF